MFRPEFHRSLRCALIGQVIGIILAAMILDTGLFAFRLLCISLVFWILTAVFARIRHRPSILERVAIGGGPMFIFWIMFFVG